MKTLCFAPTLAKKSMSIFILVLPQINYARLLPRPDLHKFFETRIAGPGWRVGVETDA